MSLNTSLGPFSVIATLLLAGCAGGPLDAGTTPNYDATFGQAVRQAVARQTLNPDGPSNRDPVAGIDGESAKNAIDRYQGSFRAPTQTFEPTAIGGGLSSGQ